MDPVGEGIGGGVGHDPVATVGLVAAGEVLVPGFDLLQPAVVVVHDGIADALHLVHRGPEPQGVAGLFPVGEVALPQHVDQALHFAGVHRRLVAVRAQRLPQVLHAEGGVLHVIHIVGVWPGGQAAIGVGAVGRELVQRTLQVVVRVRHRIVLVLQHVIQPAVQLHGVPVGLGLHALVPGRGVLTQAGQALGLIQRGVGHQRPCRQGVQRKELDKQQQAQHSAQDSLDNLHRSTPHSTSISSGCVSIS